MFKLYKTAFKALASGTDWYMCVCRQRVKLNSLIEIIEVALEPCVYSYTMGSTEPVEFNDGYGQHVTFDHYLTAAVNI